MDYVEFKVQLAPFAVQTPRSRIPIDTLWEEHLVFHMRIFSLMCQNINLFTKISLECWLWRTQN